jgi:hypothetical protein
MVVVRTGHSRTRTNNAAVVSTTVTVHLSELCLEIFSRVKV